MNEWPHCLPAVMVPACPEGRVGRRLGYHEDILELLKVCPSLPRGEAMVSNAFTTGLERFNSSSNRRMINRPRLGPFCGQHSKTPISLSPKGSSFNPSGFRVSHAALFLLLPIMYAKISLSAAPSQMSCCCDLHLAKAEARVDPVITVTTVYLHRTNSHVFLNVPSLSIYLPLSLSY